MLSKKTKWGISILITGLPFLIHFLYCNLGKYRNLEKVDDWQYSSYSPSTLVFVGLYIISLLLAYMVFDSFYLVYSNHPSRYASAEKRRKGIINISFFFFSVILCVVLYQYAENMCWIALIILIPVFSIIYLGINIYLLKCLGVAVIVMFLFAVSVPKFLNLSSSSDRIGMSVGGSKDISNFRKNIEHNFLPFASDITYEGLFYDYFFDTGDEDCKELFCPYYSFALSTDPFSGEMEYYLNTGLNSDIQQNKFQRKPLNLVIVLDISGSMSSPFYRYYYDSSNGRINNNEPEDKDKSKQFIANNVVADLLDHLRGQDRFGMVLFNNSAYLAKPLRTVSTTDMNAIKGHIHDIQSTGGTNMSAGYMLGTELLEELNSTDLTHYENRIIFLTDAMPNVGYIRDKDLLGMTKENADKNIFTSFIGVGVDFNTELIESISKVRGANYFSVHSSSEFRKRMDEEFEYLVSPLVFNLNFKMFSNGFNIKKVYGSPEANESTNEIMKVNTLFPSKKNVAGTKGGIILMELNKISPDTSIFLHIEYEDRSGVKHTSSKEIIFPSGKTEFYDNSGIRKGILLSRYVNLARSWINFERGKQNPEKQNMERIISPNVIKNSGLIIPVEPKRIELNEHEHTSTVLTVSGEYPNIFKYFKSYFSQEMKFLKDSSLSREYETINKLSRGWAD